MQRPTLVLVLASLLAPTGAAIDARLAVTPVQKVVQMLNGMLVKGQEEKAAEEVQFAAYKQFCSDTEAEKTRAVQEAGESIEMLQASIESAKSAADTLQREVAELDEQVATWTADQKAAAAVRQLEREDYLKAHQDYSDTVDAITKAMQVLKAQAVNKAQASTTTTSVTSATSAALLELLRGLQGATSSARPVLAAFLARDDPEMVSGAENEAYAYEFRSGGVTDMLQKLKDKFIEERTTLEKEELTKRHAFELFSEDLKSSVANAGSSRSGKAQQRAKELQASAQMEGELADTSATRADDQKYLADMTATCKVKAADFEERQKLRADEISALSKAIEILSGAQVAGAAETYLPAFAQRRALRRSLAQVGVRGAVPAADRSLRRAAGLLELRAAQLGSRALSALAERAREDPFAKVKKMVQDLISRLQEQAGEEAQHESWCKAELATNEQIRTDRSTTVERLTSEIDSKGASISKLASEITEFSQQLSEMTAGEAERTKIREEEKARNEKTIKDAKEAQTAVDQAVTVLREFYSQAAEATALVQRRQQQRNADRQPPPIFEGAYQGLATEKGGVIAMLEVIQSDFARLESETSAAEVTAQKDYDRQVSEAAILKAQTEKDIEHRTSAKQTAEQELVELNNDLASAQKELTAAQAYFEKLKPSCLDAGLSFEERAQRRQEEIESLQEALKILNGEDIAMR